MTNGRFGFQYENDGFWRNGRLGLRREKDGYLTNRRLEKKTEKKQQNCFPTLSKSLMRFTNRRPHNTQLHGI